MTYIFIYMKESTLHTPRLKNFPHKTAPNIKSRENETFSITFGSSDFPNALKFFKNSLQSSYD